MRDDVKNHYLNRVKGAVFGQAIGDALGHPIEFKKTHKVEGLEPDNKFTDDTQMFCAIGEALLKSPPHENEEQFMERLTLEFVEWRKNPLGGSHRAPGGTCMEAVRKLGTGRPWRQAGATVIGKGNGSAMRAGVIGVRYWKDPEYAFRIGCLSSINTHNNLESILAAGMVAYLVAASIAGLEWLEAVAKGIQLCSEFETRIPEYPTNSVPLNNTRDGQSPWKAIANFGQAVVYAQADYTPKDYLKTIETDFTAVPAVAEAIYFNTRHDEYSDMALECANESDDCDTITAIAGTIMGARVGYDDLQPWGDEESDGDWVKKVELSDYLNDLATRLFEAAALTEEVDKAVDEALMLPAEGLDIDSLDEDFAFETEEAVAAFVNDDEENDFEVEF